MKMNRIIPIILFSLVFVTSGFAQRGKMKEANKELKKFAYIKASEILLEVAEDGHRSTDLFEKLGNSFYFNNKMEQAAKWYGELMKMEDDTIDPEYYYRYAQALKYIENYDEADIWMNKFREFKSDDLRAQAFAETQNYLSKIDSIKAKTEIYNVEDINTKASEYGTTQFRNQIVFASSRKNEVFSKVYQWNDEPFLDLYKAYRQDDGSFKKVGLLDGEINTKLHESSAAYTPDEELMFFTRNNYLKRQKRDDQGVTRLQLYRAKPGKFGDWDEIEPVHFNSDEYSVAHPTVNVYGNKIYFASDMPGSQGMSDIFMADINQDGTLGEPVNLGERINTEGRETFPFINSEGDLYFSSDGYPGLGGLDIYVIRDFENKSKSSQNLVVENVGRPINSAQDDFGYYENVATGEGFFSSNRPGGKGSDDIYAFYIPDCSFLIQGVIKNKQTQEIIPMAGVSLLDENGELLADLVADENGEFSFETECDVEYLIRAQKDGFTPDEKRLLTSAVMQDLILELELDPEDIQLGENTDIAKALGIETIYFDLDKSDITPQGALELAKVIAVMKQYPNMEVDVRSHTDSRAPFTYNERLSQRRNDATINYIVEEGGIDRSRLTGKGYGETQLVNDCADGVDCTEEQHQANRRSEFFIESLGIEENPAPPVEDNPETPVEDNPDTPQPVEDNQEENEETPEED